MGFIKNMISGQFIDVIEWIDDSKDTIVHRYDRNGKDIMMGAQLTVRESQIAVFVNEGQLADVFTPGRYELSTQNMPIMTKIKAWKFGFNSPFKAEVYFISTKQFRDIKWGTTNPVMMRDAEFGMIRIRAFGSLAFRVSDPIVFMKEVFGTNSFFTVEDIAGQLKRVVVSNISDAIAESKIPALDLASNYDELSEFTLNKLRLKVSDLGIYLSSFVIENISLPEEVEKAMDRRTSMGVVVTCQDEKSQIKNKEKALKVLRTKLYEQIRAEKDAAYSEHRKGQIGTGDRSERIRTYNFPQGRVTDHRIGLTLYKIDEILNGDLDEIIEALSLADQSEKLSNLGE